MLTGRALLVCPACGGDLDDGWSCAACGAHYGARNGIAALRLTSDLRTEAVRSFYDRAPFPGYPATDTHQWLRARASRSPFPAMLDEATRGDARIVEIGCGTGAMALYLARADRVVIGADLSRNALMVAKGAAERCGLDNILFVETDITALGLRAASFDLVYCSGVLHHTPDPAASFKRVARLVRPGGTIVIGLYSAFARIPFLLRRGASRLFGERVLALDPVLRDRDNEPGRREAWLRDQYEHPEEHRHTLAQVQRWFRESGVDYVRAYPSAQIGGAGGALMEPEGDSWLLEGWLAQLNWIRQLGRDGGLFVAIGRRAA